MSWQGLRESLQLYAWLRNPKTLIAGLAVVLLALFVGVVFLPGFGRRPAAVSATPTTTPSVAIHPTTTAQSNPAPTSAPPVALNKPTLLVNTRIDPVGGCQVTHITFNWRPVRPLDPSYVGQPFTIEAVGNEIAEVKKIGNNLAFDTITSKAAVSSSACS